MRSLRATIATLAVTLVLVAPDSAEAQEPPPLSGATVLEVGVGGHLPVGGAADLVGVGVGGFASVGYRLNSRLDLLGVFGLLYNFDKDVSGESVSYMQIPLMVGGRVHLNPALYANAVAGFNFVRVSSDGSDFSETEFGAMAGAGYELGRADLQLQLFASSFDNFDDSLGLLFSVGFEIAAI